mmetsp:Transcript_21459/g.29196  ORF Transcript_21459/g.29196 Transcript_21459/m.29196 type:complete len:80 (+) Transcript_21459:614-853(+)
MDPYFLDLLLPCPSQALKHICDEIMILSLNQISPDPGSASSPFTLYYLEDISPLKLVMNGEFKVGIVPFDPGSVDHREI